MCTISLKRTRAEREKVLQSFGKTFEDVNKDVELVLEWIKMQPHLPETPSRNMIEFFLVITKFSMELTKQKIDMYYTVKSMFPEVFEKINPKNENMKIGFQTHCIIPLPKLIDDIYRVGFFKVFKTDKPLNGYTPLAGLINVFELRLQEDLMVSDVAVFDFEHVTFEQIIKTTPTQVKVSAFIFEKVFSHRVKECHVINHPPMFDKILTLAKMVIKPKLHQRLHLHDSVESLTKFVPLEVLPSDYGGKEKSVEELHKMWINTLEAHSDWYDHLDTIRVNEKLRPTPLQQFDIYGVQGTFRKLNLD